MTGANKSYAPFFFLIIFKGKTTAHNQTVGSDTRTKQ
jgi:hypothetical protein